ncbi:hypothetical protein DAEQUDRAFT_807016 [Daedalea quercina L-15889]|uniref:Uncharacterized protein n=1 Tax=Daedalea quercina L-15889 TaxID=1314783 RepID=A0A165UBI3_9APHY|nr:hypothetical protein DAEQUDRAFT_807016 [Daedalea quercina L-15889]
MLHARNGMRHASKYSLPPSTHSSVAALNRHGRTIQQPVSRSQRPPRRRRSPLSRSRRAQSPLRGAGRMPTLLWRRKTSTPFLPGAWPNPSVSDQGDDQRLPVYSDDAPPQLPELRHLSPREDGGQGEQDPAALAEEGWGLPIVTERHAFEDNGRAVGTRVRDLRPVTVPSPASTSAPLSASLSQASTFSDPTDSEGVLTPQSIQGPLWLSTHSEVSFPQTNKDTILSGSGSSYHSFDDHQTRRDHVSHDATIDTTNVNATISSSNTADFLPHRSATRAAYRTPPILDFSEPLPQSRISLDWDRVTSSPNNASLQSPDSPQSPIEFSVPSTVGSPVLDEGEPAVFNSAAMATTFFPVPTSSSHRDGQPSETREDVRQAASPSLSLPSAYSLGTDSPVLPAEAGPNQESQSPTHSPYTLMAADLDAFAAAATGSSLSLPTSLHSAASDALLAEAEMDQSAAPPPARLRAYSGDSVGQSPSPVGAACGSNALEFPSTPKAARDHDEYDGNGDAAVEEAIRMRSRRMSAPLLHSPRTPVHNSVQRERSRTTSSRVEVQQAEDVSGAGSSGSSRPTKLPVLGKMRKLGGKFLSLFNSKGAKASGTGVVVDSPAELAVKKTRTTAVTKVEFESEHPIPAPETPARDARASRRSLPLKMSKPSPNSSQSLRCDSFLPIEDPESASKGILSIPLQHMRGSPSIQFKKDRGASGSDPASPTRVARARTLTAPAKPQFSKGISSDNAQTVKQARRFSLSSAFSRSRLDVLKTTVAPHPPLPGFPQSPTCDQHPHREEPVRPVSMITPTGLDSKSSQASLKGTISGPKKGKERARPVSMVVSSGAPRRTFLDHPQITVQAPSPVIGVASIPKEDKQAKHSSMLVGKEKDARRDMIVVAGSRFKMHRPMKSANQLQDTHNDVSATGGVVQMSDVVPRQITEEASAEEVAPAAEASHKTVVRERVPIERLGPDEAVQPDPAPTTDIQAHTRRFSLSSAISQRASRARSMIVSVGRRSSESERAADSSGSTDATATPAPSPGASSSRTTHRRGRGSTFGSIIGSGVHFDILTPGFGFVIPTPASSPPRTGSGSPPASRRLSTDMDFRRDRGDAPILGPLSLEATRDVAEVEEYPSPDSDLDSMSFAGTTTLLEGMESSISMNSSYADSFVDAREELTESSVGLDTPRETPVRGCAPALGEPFAGGEPVVKRVELARALSSAVGSCGDSRGGTPTAETVEKEEERGFLRALGLEVPVDQTNKTAATGEVQ